jgi:hypothetical protein
MAKKTPKKTSKNTLSGWIAAPRKPTTMNDVKTAILLVSLTINSIVFIGWLALQLTTDYDQQVFNLMFDR